MPVGRCSLGNKTYSLHPVILMKIGIKCSSTLGSALEEYYYLCIYGRHLISSAKCVGSKLYKSRICTLNECFAAEQVNEMQFEQIKC